jgi:hypothetical protein
MESSRISKLVLGKEGSKEDSNIPLDKSQYTSNKSAGSDL